MRDILFRGKVFLTGKWMQGYYVVSGKEGTGYILDSDFCANVVYKKTVGQYTGLKDKNGVKIFEGDIVKYSDEFYPVAFERRNGTAYFGIVISRVETWGFGNSVPANGMEVVGNIYDDPELLKGD